MRFGFLALWIVAGCSVERVGVDGACTYNSDCQDVLACAAGRCRPQCLQDRDCDPDLRCLPAGTLGLSACLAPDAPLYCGLDSDCPETAHCVDGECRAECLADEDCSAGGRCDRSSGTCERPLDSLADAGAPDDAEVASCDDGGFACGSGCVDLYTSDSNCGACGYACPDNESCVGALCVCEPPHTSCGGLCVDLATSEDHCGACGAACEGPCNESTCCGTGRESCGGTCLGILDDPDNCGGCGHACDGRAPCVDGTCRAPNDRCEGAVEVALAGPITEVTGSTRAATDSRGACDPGRDVFYAITLARRELVWIEISGPDVHVGFRGDCAVDGVACPRPECPRDGGSDAWRVLDAGRHVLAVNAGASNDGGDFTMRIHHLPVEVLLAPPIPAGAFAIDGELPTEGSPATACAGGAERAHFFVTCPDAAGGAATASTCATSPLDTTLGYSSTAGAPDCNDDGACAPGAQLSLTLPPGAGLHVLTVGAAASGEGGAYRLTGSRP